MKGDGVRLNRPTLTGLMTPADVSAESAGFSEASYRLPLDSPHSKRLGPVCASAMTALNENQLRRIISTFSHVDGLLKHVEALCHPDPSPFARERPDLSQDEARLLLSFIVLARKRMVAALDRLEIPRPEQIVSARRSVGTSLLFAEISLSELEARSLQGYGPVDARAGEEVTALASDLQQLMRRGGALLRESEEDGLVERVAGVPGPAGEILRSLLALSTRHGLTEMRPLIAAAAERATATTLDVGVFGRVSAGKSSLINALVGRAVLPVGATPVTAVPLRIRRGPQAVEIRFNEAQARQVALEELHSFATEEKNPQNKLGVRSIEVTLPSAPEGLGFLDTPGVGSLASTGAAQAFAWLPRCDLGLVLVAAGTPLGRDETALVSGLRHAGIDCCLLLSKADLLDEEETRQAIAYVAAELRPVLGSAETPEVRPVSIRPGFAAGLERLQSEMLRPLAADHARRATKALRTRLHRLIALTAAGLEGEAPSTGDSAVELEKRRGAAIAAIGRATDALAGSGERLLEEVALAVSAAWSRGADGAPDARARIVSAAGRALSAIRDEVDGVHSHAAAADEGPGRRLPPLYDPEFLDAIKSLPLPRLVPAFARRMLARRRLAPLLPFLDDSLHRYAGRLRTWGEAALREVRLASPAEAGQVRDAELAALDSLVSEIHDPADQAGPGRPGADAASPEPSGLESSSHV